MIELVVLDVDGTTVDSHFLLDALQEAHVTRYGQKIPQEKLDRIYGIGGTARAALRIINDYFGKDSDCRAFSKEELSEITNLLLERNSRTRELILNNCPDRVHTVIPGILILNTLSGYLAKDEIRISKYGVREGYLCHRVLKNTI